MTIHINNSQRLLKINQGIIRKTLTRVLRQEGRGRTDLSLTLLDNQRIRELNRQYLKRDKATDVLSFPLQGKEDAPGDRLIGEIVVSVKMAIQQAGVRKIPPEKELLLYCVHGLLHLLGYDDITPRDRKRMEKRQRQILNEK